MKNIFALNLLLPVAVLAAGGETNTPPDPTTVPAFDCAKADPHHCEKPADCVCKDTHGCFKGNLEYYEHCADKKPQCEDFCVGAGQDLVTTCEKNRCAFQRVLHKRKTWLKRSELRKAIRKKYRRMSDVAGDCEKYPAGKYKPDNEYSEYYNPATGETLDPYALENERYFVWSEQDSDIFWVMNNTTGEWFGPFNLAPPPGKSKKNPPPKMKK